MKKRLLSTLLVLCMVLALLPETALAAGVNDIAYSVTGGNIYFDKATGTVTDCDANVTAANIPSEIDGVPVTKIGLYAFTRCSSLTSVTIPTTVTSIRAGAFNYCSSLTGVTIPNSVTTIEEYTFWGCSGLTSMIIPNSVTSIGEYAFYDCSGLTSVIIPNSVTSIGRQAFSGCGKLISVTIPNGVTNIGEYAFSDCSSLTDVAIPNSVTSIGEYAFSDCSSLTSVTIPASVTSIGVDVFHGCSNLTSVTLSEGLTSIGEGTFSGCSSLTSVTIPDGVTGIEQEVFWGCSSLTNVKIPDSVTSIGGYAFRGCSSLTSITIPNSVTSIGAFTFYGCSSLTDIILPDTITQVDNFTFGYCSALTTISLPDQVTSIVAAAFAHCSNLKSITIPNSVTNIETQAFLDCSSLTDIYYSGSKESWALISGDGKPSEETVTIHYNSTGPDNVGPGGDTEESSSSVMFLSGWNAETRNVTFGDSEVSPYTYTVAGSADVSGINSLLDRYVLVTMEQGDSVLEYTVTDIQPVESKIGTVSATGEHSLTIDGKTYTTSEMNASIWGQYEGKEVLYHTVNEYIKDLTVLEEKIGTLEVWDRTTGKVTIDGIVYPTYDFSDLSFVSDIDNYLNKQYYYMTAKTGNYTVFCKITEQYYPGGDLADFDATIYQATWLSKGGNAADILNYDTPSDIIMDHINESGAGLAMDAWRSFELVFDSLSDVTTLAKFATGIDQKDMYSALILTALEAKVSYDIIPSQAEEGVKLSKSLISNVSNALKADYGIELNDNSKLHESLTTIFGNNADIDAYLEDITKEWFKNTQPDLGDLGKSFKWISNGVKAVGTVEDYAEYISACITLSQTDEYIKEVLNLAYQKSNDVYGPLNSLTLAFKECLDMFSNGTDEMFEKIESGTITMIGKGATKYVINDILWKEVKDYINVACPEVAILQIGYTAGKTISSWLCNTDDAVEQYLKMDSITDIESMIDSIYNDLRLDFGSQRDVKTAATYLSAMDFSFQLRDIDCDNAYKYVDAIDSSLFSKIEQAFGKKGNAELKNEIRSIQRNYQTNHFEAETGWIFFLEDDYPGSGLYEEYEQIIDETRNGILKKEITAACPVNVLVHNQSGNVVASVVDGRVSNSADDLMIALVGDKKIIRFYNGADYYIEYVGYDIGDMDITITEFDRDEVVVRTANYYNIAVNNGKTYSIDVSAEILGPYELVDETDKSVVDYDYDSMQATPSHSVKVISGTVQQGGEIFSETTASKGEALQLNAYIPEGYEFVRWESSNGQDIFDDKTTPMTAFIMPDEDIVINAVVIRIAGYTITLNVSPATGGSVTGNGTYAEGESVTVEATPANGYRFVRWTENGTQVSTSATYSFNISSNRALTAVFERISNSDPDSSGSSSGGNHVGSSDSDPTYSITVPSRITGGTVKLSPSNASAGQRVTITIKPNAGYELDALTVTDSKGNTLTLTDQGNGKYTFTMPSSRVSIDVSFKATVPAASVTTINFTDVPANAYYADAVAWAVENGITFGITDTTFGPEMTCTRAQIVSFLWRQAGSPTMSGTNPFTDVSASDYYYDAVLWAVENGITAGTGDGTTFSPSESCTRAQAMTFLYRDKNSPVASGTSSFTDVSASAYYAHAIQWAVANGVTYGVTDTSFGSDQNCTRAQIMSFMYRAKTN